MTFVVPIVLALTLVLHRELRLILLGDDLGFDMDTPWRALPSRAREALLEGRNHKVHVKYRNRYGRDRSYTTGFEGVVPFRFPPKPQAAAAAAAPAA